MKIRILSIDGGGMRGIIPATILVRFEDYLKEYSKDEEARIGDYFDLIAGTSTGSVLVSAYLCPDETDPIKPKYGAQDALNFYLDEGKNIFKLNLFRTIATGYGTYGPRYSAKNLEKALEKYLKDVRIKDLIKPCLIPAYDLNVANAMFFNQLDSYLYEGENYYIKDVVRGSTAAPIYFAPAHINNGIEKSHTLIDGGVFANNPALCAFVEACKFKMKPSQKDILLLSLGTGSKEAQYPYSVVKHWGATQWALPLISIFGSAASETVDHQLKTLYKAIHCENQYVRVETDLTKLGVESKMDDASDKHIKELLKIGELLADEYEETLRLFAQELVKEEWDRQRKYPNQRIQPH